MYLDGEFWRRQALHDLMPYWYEHIRDTERGGFYLNLSRSWQPIPPWEKMPAMISRQVFAFSAAYLMSGEEKYLDVAREGVEYLIGHAWDTEYGGWFDMLTQTGEPKETTKSVPMQLYTNVGLTLYAFTTGDERTLSYVKKSIEIQQTYGHDNELDGYFQVLNRDLSVKDDGKNKHAHYGYVSSLLLNLWLTTRDQEILQWERHLTDLSLEWMMDEEGWVHGYMSQFDRHWKRIPAVVDGVEVVPIGAQLTAALSFLRIFHQTGDTTYREHGKALGDRINRYGWDAGRGGWLDVIGRKPPYHPIASPTISWWIQIYGSFLQLQLYNITHDEHYLERFQESESFYDRYFMDREYGGVFTSVSPDGKLIGDGGKAQAWRAAYHEIEHDLLNYLYLNVYVNRQPAVLYFRLNGPGKHFVSLVDDPSVQVVGVRINGEPWTGFDAQGRSVTLPEGKELKVEVTLAPLK
jgi:mannose/cellobiose epimerase-like protein (N-acyl-D-glucosamine 2-epimerase family)